MSDNEVFVDINAPLFGHQRTDSASSLSRHVRTPVSSRPGSRAPSPLGSNYSDDDVPTNVTTEEQLEDLPEECLSGDPIRPLQHFDEDGNIYHYALRPMFYSVFMILLTEGIERFSFYGLNYTQTSYLTGAYDKNWNAGMDAIPASSVSNLLLCHNLPAFEDF